LLFLIFIGVSEEIIWSTTCCHCGQRWHSNRTCVSLYRICVFPTWCLGIFVVSTALTEMVTMMPESLDEGMKHSYHQN